MESAIRKENLLQTTAHTERTVAIIELRELQDVIIFFPGAPVIIRVACFHPLRPEK